MVASAYERAKRAFVSLLLSLARSYGLVLDLCRDSDDLVVQRAYRRVLLKVHPDKGGTKRDAQRVQEARETWEEARKAPRQAGKPRNDAPGELGVATLSPKGGYRIQSLAVILTYQGFSGQVQWGRFLVFLRGNLQKWRVEFWCATLEESEAGKLHVHLALQFRGVVDRLSKGFSFEGLAPNASTNDYLGEGQCRKRLQLSVDRAFFYVWANKRGTQRDDQGRLCVEGNYARPSWTTVRRVCKDFSAAKGRRRFQYSKCGRTAWKLTPAVQAYILRQLLACRRSGVCTAATLQRDLSKSKGVTVEASTIRKLLLKRGYRWLPRSQKPKHSAELRKQRLAFARSVVALRPATLREKLALSLDGVVLSMPPAEATQRLNCCFQGVTHMWRKRGEAASSDLAGKDLYDKQVPLPRAIPMWGGISAGGFAIVLIHPKKKVTAEEWAKAVRAGKLTDAIRSLRPVKRSGPWTVLCDNESFLRAPLSRAAHAKRHVSLWGVPPASPDLNPVEKMWSWLRRRLRSLDLDDLRKRRRPLGKMAYIARVRSVSRSQKAQRVGSNCAKSLRKTCLEVIRKGGAAARS